MASNLTQNAIKSSFLKLLNERPLDKISVKDIVEDCGVNRNTFYYHFQDIYALVESIFEEETSRVIQSTSIQEDWQEAFIEATRFAMENKRAIYHIYHSITREQLENYLLRVSDDLMNRFVRKQAEGLVVSQEDIHYIASFYKHAIAGILLDWLQNGMKENPEYAIRKMGTLFSGNIRHTLEEASKREKEHPSSPF